MAQKMLSIDIREDLLCAVMLSESAKGVSVVGCAVAVIDERPFSEIAADLLLHVGFKGEEPCRVCLDADQFFYRNLSFPFSDKRKINRILPFELEESAPVDIESLHIDSLVTSGSNSSESSVIAAMINRDVFRQRLDELRSLGLDPDLVGISNVQTVLQFARLHSLADFVLLDAGCNRVTMYVVSTGRIDLIRSMAFDDGTLAAFGFDKNSQLVSARRPEAIEATIGVMCRKIKHTLLVTAGIDDDTPIHLTGPLSGVGDTAAIIGRQLGRVILPCDLVQPPVKVGLECGLWRSDVMTSALALGLRSAKKQSGFNFRRDEFIKRNSFKKYKKLVPRLGVPLLVCFVLSIAYLWNDFIMTNRDLKSLKMQGEQIFSETLPDVKRIINPVNQLKAEINELKKGALGEDTAQPDVKVLDLLAEISVRIPKSQNVHIVRMVADRNSILLRGLTDNFNTVDNLKKVLEKSPYFNSVTINSATLAPRESGIRFELKLQLNRV